MSEDADMVKAMEELGVQAAQDERTVNYMVGELTAQTRQHSFPVRYYALDKAWPDWSPEEAKGLLCAALVMLAQEREKGPRE